MPSPVPPAQPPDDRRARLDPYLAFDEIAQLLADHPPYRERQVRAWLARGITDADRMTDLPLALRAELAPRLPRTL